MKLSLKLFCMTLCFCIPVAAISNVTSDVVYLKAKDFLHRGYFNEGNALMKKAAESGNTNAMCLYGKSNEKDFLSGSRDDMDYWYKKAQEQGAACGYVYILGGNPIAEYVNGEHDVGSKFIEKFTPLAEKGDIDASMALAIFYGEQREKNEEEKMLKIAADAGSSRAMEQLGEGILRGYYGFYFLDANRQKDGLLLIQESANLGYDDAFGTLERYYIDHGNVEQLFLWMEKGMNIGSDGAIWILSRLYAGQFDEEDKKINLNLGKYISKERSYACIYILLKTFNNKSSLYDVYKERLIEYKKNNIYNQVDIRNGEIIAEQWLKTHKIYTDPSVWND